MFDSSIILSTDTSAFDLIDRTKNKDYYSNLTKYQTVNIGPERAIVLSLERANQDFRNVKTVDKLVEDNIRTAVNVADTSIEGNIVFQQAMDFLDSAMTSQFKQSLTGQLVKLKYLKFIHYAPVCAVYDWLGGANLKITAGTNLVTNYFADYFLQKYGQSAELLLKALSYITNSMLTSLFIDMLKLRNKVHLVKPGLLTAAYIKGKNKLGEILSKSILELVTLMDHIYKNYVVKSSDKLAKSLNSRILMTKLDVMGGEFAEFTPAASAIKSALKVSLGN